MDALSLFKFWKTNKSNKVSVDGDDDSFFEPELTLPKFDKKTSYFAQIDLDCEKNEPKIESKPQSPISILRSASPKFRIFMFGKLNKKSKNDGSFCDNDSVLSCFSPKMNDSSPFTVKFKIEDGSIVPKCTRSNSSSQLRSPKIDKRSSDESKRFSKDVVQKYLNFAKPLYSKKISEGSERFTVSLASSASFPSPTKEKPVGIVSRFKIKTKLLGKSKSSSAMLVSPKPVRNDHHCDGIEGAILHCKHSFESNSTRGHSLLSRCSSDPSHEKSVTASVEQV